MAARRLLARERIMRVAQWRPPQAELRDIAEHVVARRHPAIFDPSDHAVSHD